MRRLVIGGLWFTATYLPLVVRLEAAAIEGRVTDSAGQPVAGAKIRGMAQMRAIGGTPPNQPGCVR